jgi:hypothetical protein
MSQPIEGKAALTRRLTAEGRWGVASARKDEIATQLKADGMKRSEANAEAWVRIAKEFLPLPETERDLSASFEDATPQATMDLNLFARLPESTAESFESDTWWVLNHLESPEVEYAAAPTKGCITLFRWARREPHQFISRVVSVVGRHLKDNAQECEVCAQRQEQERENVEFVDDLRKRLGML